MRFAYADPPYIGQAHRYEGGKEVNHPLLIAYLCDEFSDGWALSLSSPTLGYILSLCPSDVRVGAWVKPFAVFKPNVNPAYAWEPVIFRGGRKRDRTELTAMDWVSAGIRLDHGLFGAKPEAFCLWIFDLLGADKGDEIEDIFPGSGTVGRAWQKFRKSPRLELEAETAPLFEAQALDTGQGRS